MSLHLSVGRVLSPDCSGAREANYRIRALETNNDGRQVTAQKVTALCHAGRSLPGLRSAAAEIESRRCMRSTPRPIVA